jgi:predicted alpha/beta-hydrolase family hydrolase
MAAIEVQTRWGNLPARYPYITHDSPAAKLAIVLPGRSYPLDAPVMWYVTKAAYAAGCDVLGVEYGYQANGADLDMNDWEQLVAETIEGISKVDTTKYSQVVLIGKSLGTLVQSEISKRISPSVRNQIFLTPLRPVISAIHASDRALVVVGDADEAFTAADIAQISDTQSVQLSVMAEADHLLETGVVSQSIDILKQVAETCGAFCEQLL